MGILATCWEFILNVIDIFYTWMFKFANFYSNKYSVCYPWKSKESFEIAFRHSCWKKKY